jgi:hypothetical protein
MPEVQTKHAEFNERIFIKLCLMVYNDPTQYNGYIKCRIELSANMIMHFMLFTSMTQCIKALLHFNDWFMLTQVVFTKEFTIRAGLSGATPAGRAP